MIGDDKINTKYEDKIQKQLFSKKQSRVSKYMDLFVGKRNILSLLKYELIINLFQNMPGAVGIFLRKVGKGVSFGKSITIRHPCKISIEDNVVIDDNCMLDAKGLDNQGIIIKEGAYIGRNSILSCKNGTIIISKNVNIGFNCDIFSASKVKIGENTLIAAYSYIVGGGHNYERTDIPIAEQEKHSHGIEVGKNCWIGAGVNVLDNTTIGNETIIGAGAVVTKDMPPYSIAAGIPAQVIKSRKNN
jgi:acetyltransferase-like isoleucine patch superfamily enzyme